MTDHKDPAVAAMNKIIAYLGMHNLLADIFPPPGSVAVEATFNDVTNIIREAIASMQAELKVVKSKMRIFCIEAEDMGMFNSQLKAELAAAKAEIERLEKERKDYMKPNPLECGEELQCNGCQGTVICDCEVKKGSSDG